MNPGNNDADIHQHNVLVVTSGSVRSRTRQITHEPHQSQQCAHVAWKTTALRFKTGASTIIHALCNTVPLATAHI